MYHKEIHLSLQRAGEFLHISAGVSEASWNQLLSCYWHHYSAITGGSLSNAAWQFYPAMKCGFIILPIRL